MKNKINNEIYNHYGERWYNDTKDPVALLRAEGEFKNLWIIETLNRHYPNQKLKILDLACGGGFLANSLAKCGHSVTGIDISQSSLEIAQKYDHTKTVNYEKHNVLNLKTLKIREKFDVICAMDLLEHVEEPKKLISEANYLLKSNGLFFFHTFNRNPISHFVIIKLVEWLVPNTPKNLHIIDYFIKPEELQEMFQQNNLKINWMKGIKPIIFSRAIWISIFKRKVHSGIKFQWTNSLLTSYAGYATPQKINQHHTIGDQ